MVLTQILRRQFAHASTRSGLQFREAPAQSWKAAQACRSQQRAHIHQLFSQKTEKTGKANSWQNLVLRNLRGKRWNSSGPTPNPTAHLGSPEPQTLSQRMKKLSKEYGWSALGVYLALSALDFPFCYLAVRLLGTDRIGRWEHAVIEKFWQAAEFVVPDIRERTKGVEEVAVEVGAIPDSASREGSGWGVEEADARNKSDSASTWTQLALAYAIHKSFIFIRVPLTAAVTPKVVKTLRSWGWDIGKKKPKK